MMKTRDKYIYNISNDKSKMLAIGLMSGTSMDGIDLSLIKTDGLNFFDQKFFKTFNYSYDIRNTIKTFIHNKKKITYLNDTITKFHAKCIKLVMDDIKYSYDEIDIIGFHGQTVHHMPEEGWTWQVGNGKQLSNILNIPVISNFRYRDICLGGEGAPLASLWHQTLFNSLENKIYPCIFLNVGGVSNITYINESKELKYCFDIGPGNGPIDIVIKEYFNMDIDHNGKKSILGKIHFELIDKILNIKWFNTLPPKSLDRNELNSHIFKCIENISPLDKLATLTKLISICLKKQLFMLNIDPKCIYVSGGGAHNIAIMRGMNEEFGDRVQLMNIDNWDVDAIEAQAFAFLAVRSFKGLPLTVNNVTGIKKDVSGGLLNFPVKK